MEFRRVLFRSYESQWPAVAARAGADRALCLYRYSACFAAAARRGTRGGVFDQHIMGPRDRRGAALWPVPHGAVVRRRHPGEHRADRSRVDGWVIFGEFKSFVTARSPRRRGNPVLASTALDCFANPPTQPFYPMAEA